MMFLIRWFTVSFLFLFCVACTSEKAERGAGDESTEVDLHSPHIGQVMTLSDRIERMCDEIYMKNNEYVELYYETVDSPTLVLVSDFDGVNKSRLKSTYNMIRYPNGSPMNIVEIPFVPRGGLYDNVYSSFYDESGNLVKFVRSSGFLLNGKEPYSETSEYLYDDTHKLIRKSYRVQYDLDSSKKVNPQEVVTSPGRIDYDIYTSLGDFFRAHPIDN